MAEPNQRDSKLIQYLNEAYGKEKELETALEAHIGMTTRAPYKKRLQRHLRETKGHSRGLERRIKKLGGSASGLQQIVGEAVGRGKALAKGPLHMARGTGEAEKLLKNAKTQFSEEGEEIATYTAIEAFADRVGDKETAKLARGIRREEERMAGYLTRLIPQLARAVVQDEVPSSQRATRRRRSTRRRTSSTRRTTSSSTRRTSGSTRRKSASGGRRASSSSRRSGSSRRTGASSSGRRSSSSKSATSRTRSRRGSSGSSSSRRRGSGGSSRRS